ncbi:MAG: LrgB family protein, partial [Lachnospiraceae bacterium]|nr:LrgB family protein [Lachnospiraceae bacterium]
TAAIIVTGILGSLMGSALCKLFRFENPIAQGVAFGTASHVIGTAKATEISELSGAVSSLSLVVSGIVTAIAFPLLLQIV